MAAPHLSAPTVGRHAARPVDDLYAWQTEALAEWDRAGRCGIVEAVTGAGKTRLALAAADRAIRDGLRVLVLVPTKELRDQWVRACGEHLPEARVGMFDSEHGDLLDDHDIVVALVHSASRYWILPDGYRGLLVADECHRYATRTYSEALDTRFERRLGISATYERDDGAHIRYLDSYFGGRVFRLWYGQALADGVIAPFDVALVGVAFGPAEQAEYDEHSEGIERANRQLRHFGVRAEELGPVEHLRIVSELAASSAGRPENAAARRYLLYVNRRRSLLADNTAKEAVLRGLAPVVKAARGSLVFTQTRASAESVAALFSGMDITTTAIFGELHKDERRSRMAAFRAATISVVAAPRILDEGVDVPEADLGIIVAANRSRRQIVQRLGRVIRPKTDGRAGRLVQLYVLGTVEDPQVAGDEHLADVLHYARAVRHFDAAQADELRAFLDHPAPLAPVYRGRHAAPEPSNARNIATSTTPARHLATAETRLATVRPVPTRLRPTEHARQASDAGESGLNEDVPRPSNVVPSYRDCNLAPPTLPNAVRVTAADTGVRAESRTPTVSSGTRRRRLDGAQTHARGSSGDVARRMPGSTHPVVSTCASCGGTVSFQGLCRCS